MPSRYYREIDDRELDIAPEFFPCDVCGKLVAMTDEDEDDDEEIVCLACVRERQAIRKSA